MAGVATAKLHAGDVIYVQSGDIGQGTGDLEEARRNETEYYFSLGVHLQDGGRKESSESEIRALRLPQ